MQTEEDGVQVTLKKKNDKGQLSNDNITVSLDKTDSKKSEKSDGEDPKPRIVLTFRSEKSGAKSSNMKIVPNDEKHEDFSPRRSSRTRGKWEWSDEPEASVSPKKEKDSSQSVSENDEISDSSPAVSKRPTRRGAQTSQFDSIDTGILEKRGSTQRLSRRIKPTAKILANEELRIGLETQNNARLGIQADRAEEGVKTRRSTRPLEATTCTGSNKKDVKSNIESKVMEIEEVLDEDSNIDSKEDPNTVMKLKHLCELGLKAINTDSVDDETEVEEMEIDEVDDEEDEDLEDEDEMDDDSEEVISKLLEADEDSSEDFLCTLGSSKSKRPRRSTRLCSSYGGQDLDRPSPLPEDDDQKEPQRRSSRRSTRYSTYESDREYCPPSKRNRSRRRADMPEIDQEEEGSRSRRLKSRSVKDDAQSEAEPEDNNSEAAGGEEGVEAARPEDESAIVATCFCEAPSNVHAAPSELTEPVFCGAVESVDGARVGCSHGAARDGAGVLAPLVRAGPRAPYLLACRLHAAMLTKHMACSACGLFCTQGTFYQCSEGHLFHLECGLPYNEVKARAGCPHCGVRSYRWQPVNTACSRVQVQMRCSNKRVYLPDQREQCTQAYLSFSTSESSKAELTSLIPEDLVPATAIQLKPLCVNKHEDEATVADAAQALCDAILAMEPLELLIPKITSLAVINEPLTCLSGGTSVHAAARRGHVAALHALRGAGADVDAQDNGLRTPLMVAVLALLDKQDSTTNNKIKKTDKNLKEESDDVKEDIESKGDADDKEAVEDDKDSIIEQESEVVKGSDEDLMKVIRYLVAAGCDVNIQGPEGMTALHMGAQHGGASVCGVLLQAGGADVEPRDHGGWSPLAWAAEHRRADVVRYPEGMTALHMGAQHGGASVCGVLLQAGGADVEPRDHGGWSPLAWAAEHRRADVVRYPEGMTALHMGAQHGGASVCGVLLQAGGADVEPRDHGGWSPLAWAAEHRRADVVRYPEGMTALHMGAQHGGASVCGVLLQAGGADVEPRDHGGWSPLAWAAEHRRADVVRLLLSHGADAATCDAEGNGAVHWCALGGAPAALRLLLDAAPHAADLPNAHHDTPLHVAARQGHYACVIILLARGAKTDVENSAGEVPADVCAGPCHDAIALNMHMARLGGRAPRCKLLCSDISKGLEAWPVPVVNEVDDEPAPADFTYVTCHVLPEPLAVDDTLATMQGCSCAGACGAGCACCVLSVRRWSARGRLLPAFPHHDPPMMFQCNQTCACDKRKCENMVISPMLSRGSLGIRACVFRTATRGWGLRTAGAVARGAPVAVYCGELLALPAADARPDDRYMFALDLKPDLLEQCADKTLLCVDACRFGSAARFINHSCRANLAPVRVFPRARDLRLPTVALFATRDLKPGEELTFDYGDKFWSVKSKWMKCECGTPECRYPEKSTESD